MAKPYKPFDSATKQLIEADPLAWLHLAGLSGTSVVLINADLTTVVSDADRIFRVTDPDYLAHLEAQTTYKTNMGERMLQYNVLTYCKYRIPVFSIVVLFRKEADGPAITGRVQYGDLDFRYTVVRLWELPVADLLAAPLALVPLAPLADLSGSSVEAVVAQMEARWDTEATAEERGMLATATLLLMGLKYSSEMALELLKGVKGMKESTTYQALLEEGRVEGERKSLLVVGTKRFGTPGAATQAKLDALNSSEQIEALLARTAEVESWDELFD
jgi:predicted transposase YdaD